MKNIKIYYEPEEIREFYRGAFKTELFRTEMEKPGSLINEMVENAAKYPLFTYDYSDHPSKDAPNKEKTEWAHFMAMLGGIANRDYDSAGISDASHFHEGGHKGTLGYLSGRSYKGFYDEMVDNELLNSVTSEIEIYLQYPQFRKQTFDQRIYADEFLNNPDYMQWFKAHPKDGRDDLLRRRKEIMLHEDPSDPVKMWIHKFAQQNAVWGGIWSRRHDQVDAKMAELHQSIDDGVPRKEAMDKFMGWLMSKEVAGDKKAAGGGEIPFPDEAVAFAGVYNLNNRYYLEAVANGEMGTGFRTQNYLEKTYGMDPKKAFTGPAATDVFGERPDWAKEDRSDHFVSQATAAYQGNFAVLYAVDPAKASGRVKKKLTTDDIKIVFQKRSNKGPNGEDQFGLLGGFASFAKKEQPKDGAVREIREESVDDKGKPTLDIAPERLTERVHEGIDYRREPYTTFMGFAGELKPEELSKATVHSERAASDPVYAAAAKAHTKGEVDQVMVKSLTEVLALGREQFTHPHEFEAIEKFAERYQGRGHSQAVGA